MNIRVVVVGLCCALAIWLLILATCTTLTNLIKVNVNQEQLRLDRGPAWRGLKLPLGDLTLAVPDPTQHYAAHEGDFCNKCDFDFYTLLLPLLPCCSEPTAAVLTGGVNKGALLDLLLLHCKAPTVHGFEIQSTLYEELQLKYSKTYNARVVLNNKGLSDRSHTLPIATGMGEGGGLFKSFRGTNVWVNSSTVETISLAQYAQQRGVQNRVCMAIIDVEGHEAKVIQGMLLMEERLAFPIFAYELGGTWVDSRNPSTWSQASTASYLINLGYRLFLIGRSHLLPVTADFFAASRVHNEGYGHFVQGNLLAVHDSILA